MDETRTVYGCIFCITGEEEELSKLIEYKCPDVRARAAQYIRHRTYKGVHTRDTKVFLPGYVFFETVDDLFVPLDFPRDLGYRVIRNHVGDWRLMGSDEDFAKWLFTYDGLLTFSKAYEIDQWIYFLSGPLKDMEGSIVKVDKRGRSALIRFRFQNKVFTTWLGYELVDPPEQTSTYQTSGETR